MRPASLPSTTAVPQPPGRCEKVGRAERREPERAQQEDAVAAEGIESLNEVAERRPRCFSATVLVALLPVVVVAWQVGAVHELMRRGIPLMLMVGLAAGCDEKPPGWATGGGARPAAQAAAAPPATVNGAPISAAELALEIGRAHV